MAIVFDSASNGTLVNPGTSMSWVHTCAGGNSALFVGITGTASASPTVTYQGSGLTLDANNNFNDVYSSMYHLLNPPTGLGTVTVTSAGTFLMIGRSLSYTGVRPYGTMDATSSGGENNSISVVGSFTTTTDNCWGVMIVKSSPFFQQNAGAGVTKRTNSPNNDDMFEAMFTTSGAGKLMSVSGTAVGIWSQSGVAFAPSLSGWVGKFYQ